MPQQAPGDPDLNPGRSDAAGDPASPDVVETETVLGAAGSVPDARRKLGLARLIEVLVLVAAAGFFALHFVHLSADFPNHSPWMDWSKYTDEGWYGDAAIRQIQRGHWYVQGDFNPGVTLPVWPALEFLLFSITGVSVVAARALSASVFGGILIVANLLVKRHSGRGSFGFGGISFAPACAVALLVASPFFYAFTRLAILEPLLMLLTMLALLAASHLRAGRIAPVVGLGILLPLMILTKTTAVFLLPSITWMLWASCGYRWKPLLRAGIPVVAIAGGLWAAYFFVLVRPHYLEDYRYLFSANAYTGMTRENAWSVIQNTVHDGMWMGKMIYPLALGALVIAVIFFRRCFRNPLVPSLMIWAGGYAVFLAYHNNLQPRYYLVVALPLTLLVPVVLQEVLWGWVFAGRGVLLTAVSAGLVAVVVMDAVETVGYMCTPEYSFVQAAKELSEVVRADHSHNPLVLSISGSNLSLMTGLPSICDDFGTMALEDRVALYKPGWYATWNQVDDDKMDALSPQFHLERVASFMAFDDPERNLLILYRLDPPIAEEPRKKKRRAIPKQLQTKMGQQPSASQLQH